MIRDRRPEDLDRLCAIVEGLGPAAGEAGHDPRGWLVRDVADPAWVYDMAPVRVAPTRNVVGHLAIYVPDGSSSTPDLADAVAQPVGAVLAIGAFVVKPQTHDHGIARHLLNQARGYIEQRGKTAVLDLRVNTYLTEEFCTRYGFVRLSPRDPSAMVYRR